MSCENEVYDNNYYDFIIRNNEYLPPAEAGVCTLDGGDSYTILFVSSALFPPASVKNYSYSAMPNCYTPLSLEALDASGILQVRDTPTLALEGAGVLIGFLDSGIDSTHPAFLDESGRSRIVAVWNQDYTLGDFLAPEGIPDVPYGRTYNQDTIGEYGNGDQSGHGTYVASIAAGSNRGQYSGAAPQADIAMVQLKEAKPYLRDYYFIPEGSVCYQENDIMLGVKFLNELARSRNQALVICISVGTAMGSHSGNSPLSLFLDDLAVVYRRCVVCGTGNYAAARRHYYGSVKTDSANQEGATPNPDYQEVEIVVGENTCGFVMELWAVAPTRYKVALVSPGGELLPAIAAQSVNSQEYVFPIENTRVEIDYSQPEVTTGNQLIYFRFTSPAQGIWRARVYAVNGENGSFHMYLAQEEFQCGNVFFLTSNPDTTITDPGNARRVLTVGGYNQRQKAFLLSSGRGYTIDGQIKPELTAPGFLVDGALAGSENRPIELQYEPRTGTSAALALTAGAAALYFEWAEKQNNFYITSSQIKNFLIRGTERPLGDLYPNRQWGYGILDLYESFRLL